MKGLERALAAGARAIAVFTGATDTFPQRTIGMTVQESLAAFGPVVKRAVDEGLWVRISICFGCPYEGSVEPRKVLDLARCLLDLGCEELSLGDTIGVALPTQVPAVVGAVLAEAAQRG